jgi:hypothetical protein
MLVFASAVRYWIVEDRRSGLTGHSESKRIIAGQLILSRRMASINLGVCSAFVVDKE